MIRFENNIGKIFFGANKIGKVYFGSTKVYPSGPPSIPTLSLVSASSDSITIKRAGGDGAASFNWYCDGELFSTNTDFTATKTGLSHSTSHTFYILAVNDKGTVSSTTYNFSTTAPPAPEVRVYHVSFTQTSASFGITNSIGAKSVDWYWHDGNDYVKFATTTETGIATKTGLRSDSAYWWLVIARGTPWGDLWTYFQSWYMNPNPH